MVWDLRRAMLKKEEFESARLMDFDFRQRVRATRLLARYLGLDENRLVRDSAAREEHALLEIVAKSAALDHNLVLAEYAKCLAEARRELIAEIGDPTPHRLG